MQESRSSSGVEQRIRNAWVGGSNPSCGTNEINGLRCEYTVRRASCHDTCHEPVPLLLHSLDFWHVWRQRVLANVFSIITIPPVIVLAFAGQLVGAHATRRAYLELALITVGVLVVGIPVFGLDSPGPSTLPALLLAPLPFLIWAAVRVGVGGTGLTLLIVAGIALANAYIGLGPFINQAPDVNVLSLQIFLPAISIPILLLAALVEERRQAEEALKQTSKRAELALTERSLQLAIAGEVRALVGKLRL